MIKNSIKYVLNKAGYSINKLPNKRKLDIYHKLYSKDVLKLRPFFNIGAGPTFFHPYWTNIDYKSEWYINKYSNTVHYDLMSLESLPIDNESALIIYTSHTIEHVSEEAVKNLINESYRTLKNGGIIRITCPDSDLNFDALLRNDSDWFYWDKMYTTPDKYLPIYHAPADSAPLQERWLHTLAAELTPNDRSPSSVKFDASSINEIIKDKSRHDIFDYFTSFCKFNPDIPRNHITWWNHEKIKNILKDAGFKKINRSGFKQSSNPILRDSALFDITHPQMSLYIEAIK